MSEHTNSNAALSLLNIPHFRGLLKKARHGHYSFKIAMTDIIDNVILKANRIDVNVLFHQGKLFKIIISDDYLNGFENINETGPANPMNWTHRRAGQTSDEETSEYGVGLKEASCFLAAIMRIYTRAVKNGRVSYHEVECNFDLMAEVEDAIDSYKTDIKSITQSVYEQVPHPFETGSSIILEGVRLFENMQFSNEQECIELLKIAVAEAYSDIIASRSELVIKVNGERILPEHDHFRAVLQHPVCAERLVSTTVITTLQEIDGGKKVIKTMAKVCFGNEIWYYNFNEVQTTKAGKESVSLRESKSEAVKKQCNDMISDSDNRKIDIRSTSTYGTNLEKTHIFKGAVRYKRKGRNYGDIQMVNLKGAMSNDGYLNHVYHETEWESKELNPFLGICSNKQIDPTRKNQLTLAICKLLGKINNLLNSRKLSGDNDSDNASVSTAASSVSDVTMNSAASSRRRTKKPTPVITSPISRGGATTSIAAAEPTTTVQPDNATIVSADETANNAEPDATLQEQPLSGSNNIVAEEPPRQPNIQEMIYARLNETIAEIEHTLAEQLQLPAPPVTNTPEEVPEVNPPTATVPIQPLRQTNPVYTRITNQDRTYLSKRDAEIQLENLSTFAHQNPHIHIEEDMMELITEIARQSGGILFLIDTVKNMMTRGKPENAHVVGGSTLAKIHAKYISDDDIV